MANAWIPFPVGALWTVLFVLVLLVHLYHLVVMQGRHRLWHAGHVVMAGGMTVMFAPTGGMIVPAAAGVAVFATAAVVLAAVLLTARGTGVALGTLWLVSVLDLAWMAVMFTTMSTPWLWTSLLGGAWFGGQAIGWAGGRLGRVLEHGGLGEASPAVHPSGRLAATAGGAGGSPERARAGTSSEADVAVATHGTDEVVDGGTHDTLVRATLTVMALGMAYMFLAMQFGSAAGTPAMGGLPGM